MAMQTRSKPSLLLGIALAFLCVLFIGAGLWMFFRNSPPAPSVIDMENAFSGLENLDPAAENGLPSWAGENSTGLFDTQTVGWRINQILECKPDGKGVALNVQNPPKNQYLFVVEICTEDTPSLLYQSRYLAPNQYIEKVDFRRQLAPGKHPAKVYINIVDPQTLHVADILECQLTIEVSEKE